MLGGIEKVMKDYILLWEAFGVLVIFILGSLMHSAFEYFNGWLPVALIAPVNESVWEHLKLGFWPLLLYAVIEYYFLRGVAKNFWIGKAVAVFLIPLIIVSLHYTYKEIIGHHVVLIDIIIFAIAIALGQMASYKILTAPLLTPTLNIYALILIIIFGLLFIIFTFCPLHLPIFKNPYTGGYGL